jgi:hypothetical protein
MVQKPIYIDTVTHIPAVWANAISDLVFDVFALARTVPEARKRLGLGKLALQNNDQVVIEGGTINNTVIGNLIPQVATFLNVSVTELIPQSPASLTSKQYVDGVISTAFSNLNLQDMSRQPSNAVNITGGYGVYDTLRVRNAPATPMDVLTLGFFQNNAFPTATTSIEGKVRLATVDETTAGIDSAKAVTSEGVKAAIDAATTTIVSGLKDVFNQ